MKNKQTTTDSTTHSTLEAVDTTKTPQERLEILFKGIGSDYARGISLSVLTGTDPDSNQAKLLTATYKGLAVFGLEVLNQAGCEFNEQGLKDAFTSEITEEKIIAIIMDPAKSHKDNGFGLPSNERLN